LQERSFTLQDQTVFAALSGDYNPLHVDPLAARRTMFGRAVVHGVHAALWGLDVWLGGRAEVLALRSLRATFQGTIGLGEKVGCFVERLPDNHVEIELRVGDAPVLWMTIQWASRRDQPPEAFSRRLPERLACRARSLEELATATGTLPLCFVPEGADVVFPNLRRSLDPNQIAQILATTRLVGMECPGLHSVFSGLDLTFSDETVDTGEVTYRVTTCDPGLSLVSIEVRGPGMTGILKAFVRPAPRAQPSIQELRRQIRMGEFRGQRALIIGGSRGLGEVTAKLLAAGGASVTITYHRGADDARRIIEEIDRWGGQAACMSFDVLQPPDDLGEHAAKTISPTHLYYFATPHISAGRPGSFSGERFRVFCDYYVTGFLSTVRIVQSLTQDLRAVFYPSSIYLNEIPPNMAEYAAAKMAGETVARLLEKTTPGLTVHLPRLSRLATDQTATFLPVTNLDPAPLLLQHLRDLRQRAGTATPAGGS